MEACSPWPTKVDIWQVCSSRACLSPPESPAAASPLKAAIDLRAWEGRQGTEAAPGLQPDPAVRTLTETAGNRKDSTVWNSFVFFFLKKGYCCLPRICQCAVTRAVCVLVCVGRSGKLRTKQFCSDALLSARVPHLRRSACSPQLLGWVAQVALLLLPCLCQNDLSAEKVNLVKNDICGHNF